MQSYVSYESSCSPFKYFPSIKIFLKVSHPGDVCLHINQLRHERLYPGMGRRGEQGGGKNISFFNFLDTFFLQCVLSSARFVLCAQSYPFCNIHTVVKGSSTSITYLIKVVLVVYHFMKCELCNLGYFCDEQPLSGSGRNTILNHPSVVFLMKWLVQFYVHFF